MAEYIQLLGAEDVRSAGSAMRNAASEMTRAASSFEESLHNHRLFMEDWLMRLEVITYKKEVDRCGVR